MSFKQRRGPGIVVAAPHNIRLEGSFKNIGGGALASVHRARFEDRNRTIVDIRDAKNMKSNKEFILKEPIEDVSDDQIRTLALQTAAETNDYNKQWYNAKAIIENPVVTTTKSFDVGEKGGRLHVSEYDISLSSGNHTVAQRDIRGHGNIDVDKFDLDKAQDMVRVLLKSVVRDF